MAINIKLNEINTSNAHLLPKPAQWVLALFLILILWGVGYYFQFSDQFNEISALEDQEVQLREQYTKKSNEAAQLDNLRQEVKEIREIFNVLVKQLPTDAEVPNLIQELHQAGATNGMRMNSVVPMKEISDDTVTTLPYKISISGDYAQISQFVRDVGHLSRIVTLDSLNLKNDEKNKDKNILVLDAVANTYKAVPIK